MSIFPISTRNTKMRNAVAGWWRWGVAHAPDIHYAEVRPMRSANKAPGALPLTMDCSETVTTFTRWAGGPDPTGSGYNGYGNTDSMAAHLRRIRKRRTRRGDLAIFGPPGATVHVVQLLQGGFWRRDPLVGTHGEETGPHIWALSQEQSYRPGQALNFYRLVSHTWKE